MSLQAVTSRYSIARCARSRQVRDGQPPRCRRLRGAYPAAAREGGRARGEVRRCACHIERPREVVALAEAAVEVTEHLSLLAPFDPLGDDVEVERAGEPQDRVSERRVVGTGPEPVDERLRDLEDVDREIAEVAEGRVAGAEVVEREADA